MRNSTFLLALLLTLGGTARAADPVFVGGIPDVVGPRTLGLAALIGAASGNEGLYVNPGAIAARKRYAIEVGGYLDRRGAETAERYFGGSIVDSESSPLTAGVSYLRAQQGLLYTGNIVQLALAGPLAEGFYFGVEGKYLALTGQTLTVPTPFVAAPLVPKLPDVKAVTGDAGILWQVAEYLSVGVAGYNLVPVNNTLVAPAGMGAGLALGSDRSFQVTADWRTEFDKRGKDSNSWAAGAEALLFDLMPVRAGWMKDGPLDTSWWSVGAGLVSQNGVALDVGYRQSIEDPKARTIAASLKVFVNMGQ